MIVSYCLCKKNKQLFQPVIKYCNERVFKKYKGIIIGKCNNCGLLKTLPHNNSQFNPKQSRDIFYEENYRYFEGLFQPVVEKIIHYKKTGKVLDIGCSSGILLQLLENKGFDVYGIEPNTKAYLTASKKNVGKIFHGILKEFIKNNQVKFDVVIYNHVLEHIENINEEMKLVKSIINKEGVLVIGVPNTDNIIFYLRQKYWESLMPNEHIWHFSRKHLVNLLIRNCFRIINISFSDDSRRDYPFFKQVYFRFLSFLNKLFNTGESLLVIAELDN